MNCEKSRRLRWGAAAMCIMIAQGAAAAAQPPSPPTTIVAPDGGLTLETAIRRALGASPLSAVGTARREALEASRDAAGLKPQPTIEVTAENFGLPMGDLYDQFQVTGTYSQRIERGGKRRARVELVNSDISVVEAEALIDEGNKSLDQAKRKTLLTQAAKMIMDDYPMIPLLQYTVPRLVKPYVGGYSAVNALDRYRAKDLYIIKH